MNAELMNALSAMPRPEIEALMDLCLKHMSDQDLADTHQLCLRRLNSVQAEIDRRKVEPPEQEGFSA